MDEDDFMNIKTDTPKVLPPEREEGAKGSMVSTSNPASPTLPPEASNLNQGNVVLVKMMTLTEWRIYPNGTKSHPTSKTWFTDKSGMAIKKKKPKKVLKVEAAKVEETEEY